MPHRLSRRHTPVDNLSREASVLSNLSAMRDQNLSAAGDAMIRADFQRMRTLAGDLRELARQVGDRSGFVHSDALDHDLTGQLRKVENEWVAHRSRLQSFLSQTAATIQQIVVEYEKTNDTVASAATTR
jgi:hypothetical protein